MKMNMITPIHGEQTEKDIHELINSLEIGDSIEVQNILIRRVGHETVMMGKMGGVFEMLTIEYALQRLPMPIVGVRVHTEEEVSLNQLEDIIDQMTAGSAISLQGQIEIKKTCLGPIDAPVKAVIKSLK